MMQNVKMEAKRSEMEAKIGVYHIANGDEVPCNPHTLVYINMTVG
jgi:hypothetical protein